MLIIINCVLTYLFLGLASDILLSKLDFAWKQYGCFIIVWLFWPIMLPLFLIVEIFDNYIIPVLYRFRKLLVK